MLIMEQVHQHEKKSNAGMYILVICIAIVVLGFFALKGNNDDNGKRTDITINENDIIIGQKNAPVTIVEFTDFSCPFCAAANGYNQQYINSLKSRDSSWQAPMPKIYNDYVKSGKVRIVMKYYPGHGQGQEAHRVAWSFYSQLPDKFEEYKQKVFAEQENANNVELMKELAVSLGADKNKINQDLADKKYESRFNEQTLQGMNAGVQGTPTFFVNGLKIEGAASYADFQKVIESELS